MKAINTILGLKSLLGAHTLAYSTGVSDTNLKVVKNDSRYNLIITIICVLVK
jgi:hypothetical protein